MHNMCEKKKHVKKNTFVVVVTKNESRIEIWYFTPTEHSKWRTFKVKTKIILKYMSPSLFVVVQDPVSVSSSICIITTAHGSYNGFTFCDMREGIVVNARTLIRAELTTLSTGVSFYLEGPCRKKSSSSSLLSSRRRSTSSWRPPSFRTAPRRSLSIVERKKKPCIRKEREFDYLYLG